MCLVDYLYLVEYFVLFSFSLGNGISYFNEEPVPILELTCKTKRSCRENAPFSCSGHGGAVCSPSEGEEPVTTEQLFWVAFLRVEWLTF